MSTLNMATRAATLRQQPADRGESWRWFREFIRYEVAPYPGRVNTVIRMTATATLVMIIVVTFHIPNAFLAAYFSILLARENLAATWNGGRTIVLGFGLASLYTLLGMMLFRGYPITHFFWVIASLYLVFFVMRTATNYAAAIAFGVPIVVALPVWDTFLPNQLQVEGTLWPVLIIAIGAGVTVATEAVYRIFDRSDPLMASIDDLLLAVQQVVETTGSLHTAPHSIRDRIFQYDMIGTGRLRTALQRRGIDPAQRAQRSALISLTGRLISLAANLERRDVQPSHDEVIRFRALADRLRAIRAGLRKFGSVSASSSAIEAQSPSSIPMLQEMEEAVSLIPEVFRENFLDSSQNAVGQEWWRALFVADAFENREYRRFALAGCLAASLCYALYNALDWPGISTGVLTCIVTGLSTIGTSLQKQFLRLAGFVVGGVVLGISAQILILPAIDSVFGFALFFAACTALAAWFATSSPRLSYFGLQIALAFYFVNLQDFQIQTDLTIARDKVIGVLLGILAMGFIFDRFGAKSDAKQLRKLLTQNIRMLAELAVCQAVIGRAVAGSQLSRLRSQINDNFASLESQADAVSFEFEFRRRRVQDVAERERFQKAQPAMRSIYLLELSFLSHRGRWAMDGGLNQEQNRALDEFLNKYSDELMHIAAWMGQEEIVPAPVAQGPVRLLQPALADRRSAQWLALSDICERMVSSLRILRNEC